MEPSAPPLSSTHIRKLRTKDECVECIELGKQSNRMVIFHLSIDLPSEGNNDPYNSLIIESAKENPSAIFCEVDLKRNARIRSAGKKLQFPPQEMRFCPITTERIKNNDWDQINLEQIQNMIRQDRERDGNILFQAIKDKRDRHFAFVAEGQRLKLLYEYLEIPGEIQWPENIVFYYNGLKLKVLEPGRAKLPPSKSTLKKLIAKYSTPDQTERRALFDPANLPRLSVQELYRGYPALPVESEITMVNDDRRDDRGRRAGGRGACPRRDDQGRRLDDQGRLDPKWLEGRDRSDRQGDRRDGRGDIAPAPSPAPVPSVIYAEQVQGNEKADRDRIKELEQQVQTLIQEIQGLKEGKDSIEQFFK